VAAGAAPEDTGGAAVPAGVATMGIVDADPLGVVGDAEEHPDSATTASTATAIDRRT
jgi:hypothetical protein